MKNIYLLPFISIIAFSCLQLPTKPDSATGEETFKKSGEIGNLIIQLWAGRVKYAAYVGGGEWRATFEVKVIMESGENIRDKFKVKYYWKQKHSLPVPEEDHWISGGEFYPHGLMSIDGNWLDRQGSSAPPFWMRAHIVNDSLNLSLNIIGLCLFKESVEQPDTTWISWVDMQYDVGDRVLASLKGE